MPFLTLRSALAGLLSLGLALAVNAATVAAADNTFTLADGVAKLTVPEGWKATQPKSRIIEYEFEIAPVEGDSAAGRTTVMGAGGSIDDNINRWYGQFNQADGSSTKDKAKLDKRTVSGQEVVVVDVSGTYMDRPGPFAPGPAIERPNYRMLAAIISLKKDGKPAGNYFIKFYGPQATVAKHEAAFLKMIDSLQVN
ncbi:MAG: hypothetical protein JSS27_06540 [Planctomycetes bacterium]|nr:hypothetical protein [Planctomycetota bacterium]